MKTQEPVPYWDEKGDVVWLDHSPRWWKRSERHLYPVYYPGGYKPRSQR